MTAFHTYLKRIFLLAISLWLITACTKPIDADFSGSQKVGLSDDEMLWIQQIHRNPGPNWMPNATREDSARIRTFNLPIFEQVIPELIRDIISGKLKAYEDFELAEEEKEIQDLDKRLKSFGVSKRDFSSFTQVIEVFSIVNTRKKRYKSNPKYVRLVWRDPKGKVPDRNFATVSIQEIREEGDYQMRVENLSVPFTKYLEFERAIYFPVYVRDNKREYATQSPEESAFLQDKVTRGEWSSIEWIEGKINISGKDKIDLEPKEVIEFAGVYQFPPTLGDSLGKPRDVYLTAESDYLIVDWSHRFRIEKILPFMENAFFSPTGEVYVFDYENDTLTGELYVFSKSDTLMGERITQ